MHFVQDAVCSDSKHFSLDSNWMLYRRQCETRLVRLRQSIFRRRVAGKASSDDQLVEEERRAATQIKATLSLTTRPELAPAVKFFFIPFLRARSSLANQMQFLRWYRALIFSWCESVNILPRFLLGTGNSGAYWPVRLRKGCTGSRYHLEGPNFSLRVLTPRCFKCICRLTRKSFITLAKYQRKIIRALIIWNICSL